MDIERSPTGSGQDIERSGSQPNLSTISAQGTTYTDLSHITIRNKRKYCSDNDMNNQLADIQKQMAEMMLLLTTSINTQNESSAKIASDITAIKNEVLEIKATIGKTEQKLLTINMEHEKIKTEIQNITCTTGKMETRIASLECSLQNYKTSRNSLTTLDENLYGDMLAEITEQTLRKKNVILSGIPEPKSSNFKERQTHDKEEVLKTFKTLLKDCPEPTKVMRIGKYKPNNIRAIKVHFELEQSAKLILRNKNKLKNDQIKIFPDQTPFQQAQFKNLKNELHRRTANGEDNLQIKYIKGTPKIISSLPKNSLL